MKKYVAVWILMALLAGCSTTNAMLHLAPDYSALPADELRDLAGKIEGIVAEGNEKFDMPAAGVVVDTPDIQQAIRTRAIRSPLVGELLDSGFAAEEANGLIAIHRSSAYKKARSGRQRDRDALIVMGENGNRWTIYEGLLKANNWPPKSLSAIQQTFFVARVPLLKPGQQHAEIESK